MKMIMIMLIVMMMMMMMMMIIMMIVTDSTYLHASPLPPRCRKTLNEAMPKSEFEMMRMQEDDVRLRNIANKM